MALPDTAAVRAAAVNGIVETRTVVRAGDRWTGSCTPVALPGTAVPTELNDAQATLNDAQAAEGQSVNEGQLPASMPWPASDDISDLASTGLSPDDDTRCAWNLVNTHEGAARVGEVHVNTTGGAHGKLVYQQQAGSTFTVGFKLDNDDWVRDGSFTVSNTIGTKAYYTEPNPGGFASRTYAVDHMYYGEWKNVQSGGCPAAETQTHATQSAGGVFVGVNTPSPAPWSSCHADPHGYGDVEPGGAFEDDRAQAKNYGYVDEIYGFKFGGHTGYTDGIRVEIHGGSVRTYVCGSAHVPGVPVIYHRSW